MVNYYLYNKTLRPWEKSFKDFYEAQYTFFSQILAQFQSETLVKFNWFIL